MVSVRRRFSALLLVFAVAIPAGAIEYVYDELDRLVQVIYDDGTVVTYSYDAGGNRLSRTAAEDRDGDGIAFAGGGAPCTGGNTFGCEDNCPYVANPTQGDSGGVGAAAAPDGIGDACQCGDVSGNGRVTTADAALISRALLVPPTAVLAKPELCNVGGSTACSTADAVIVARALLVPPSAAVQQLCNPAVP